MPDTALPKITIVTPSFNQARYLPATIASVLSQGYPNLEYIIIDGASTDGSVEIIKSYERHLSYWTSEKDRGQSHGIMKGFARGSGELFAWVNSDDVLLPGCLESVAACYLASGRPDIVHGNIVYLDAAGKALRFIRVPRQSRFFFFRGVWHGVAPAVFFKSSSFRAAGGLNEKYQLSMDLDIWMRLMSAGAAVAHVPRYLGGLRIHESAKTVQALRTRTTEENAETTEILNAGLPRSTPAKRFLWRRLYKVYQAVNLNYWRAYRDLKRSAGGAFGGGFSPAGMNGTPAFRLAREP